MLLTYCLPLMECCSVVYSKQCIVCSIGMFLSDCCCTLKLSTVHDYLRCTCHFIHKNLFYFLVYLAELIAHIQTHTHTHTYIYIYIYIFLIMPRCFVFSSVQHDLYTGWAKKPDCFSDQITLQQLMIERCVYVKSFRIFSRMKCIICMSMQLNIFCLICINRQYPQNCVEFDNNAGDCSIFIPDTVKQG